MKGLLLLSTAHVQPPPPALRCSLGCAKDEMKWWRVGGNTQSFSKWESEIIASFCFPALYPGCQTHCPGNRTEFQKVREGLALLCSSWVRLDPEAITSDTSPGCTLEGKHLRTTPCYKQLNTPGTSEGERMDW